MDIYSQIATRIVEQQEFIIGPVAIEQAAQISQLHIDWDKHEVMVEGDGVTAINGLVGIYADLFGPFSVEVCKEAAAKLLVEIPLEQQPSSLK